MLDAPSLKNLIVIPCLNEEEHIASLIDQIVIMTNNEHDKIIVADGGSKDRTIEIAKELEQSHPCVTYMHNPKKIQSSALNLAMQRYGNGFGQLIRMDAHCRYPENYILSLLEEASETGADSVVVSLETIGKTGFQKAAAAAQNSLLGNGGSKHRSSNDLGQWVDHGHHALISSQAYNHIGGYDETFSHNEDAELDIRLKKAGYEIWLTTKTRTVYFPRKTPFALAKQYFYYGRGRCKTALKHDAPLKLRQKAPLAAALAVAILPFKIFSFWFAVPAIIWISLCLLFGLWLGIQKQDKNIALYSGLAAAIMHLSWASGFIYEYVQKILIRDGA